MPAADSESRSLVGRIAANERWSRCDDRSTATLPARSAMLAKFEREVDPDNVLDPAERTRRADHKRRAYMQRLALKSAQSRRKVRELTATAEMAEAELAAGGDAA